MSATSYDLQGVRIYECSADGPPLCHDRDAIAIIGEAIAHAAKMVVIPASRLDPDFFQLRTRLAGEMLQKFVTYRLRLAIIGDLSEQAATSSALRSLIHELNRGDNVWFLSDMGALEKRLAQQQSGQQ